MVNSESTKGEGVAAFSERACGQGSLGLLSATNIMMLALAHSGKLAKYGP